MSAFHKTKRGQIILGDSLAYLASLKAESVDLVIPPINFGVDEIKV